MGRLEGRGDSTTKEGHVTCWAVSPALGDLCSKVSSGSKAMDSGDTGLPVGTPPSSFATSLGGGALVPGHPRDLDPGPQDTF